jgi:uncharacterized protein (TIGR00730 family)
MAARKIVMMERADAFLVLPGGLGTLDELFEVWTTATLRIHKKPIVLLDTDGFYRGLVDWLGSLKDQNFTYEGAMDRLHIVSTVDAALDLVESLQP